MEALVVLGLDKSCWTLQAMLDLFSTCAPCPSTLLCVQVQREYLDTQIRGLSNSHIIHPGIKRQKVPLLPAHGRIKDIAVPVKVGG